MPRNSCKQNWEIPETTTRLITLVYCSSRGDSAVGKSLLSEPGMKLERESDERGSPCSSRLLHARPALSWSPADPEAANKANWGAERRTACPRGAPTAGLSPGSGQAKDKSRGRLGALGGVVTCSPGLLTSAFSDTHQVPSAGILAPSPRGATSCSPSAPPGPSDLP